MWLARYSSTRVDHAGKKRASEAVISCQHYLAKMGPQSTIAHYRITTKLGEGGMGEVWRATDTKLNRDVAIKVLPDAFAHDPERMARFQREAQLLASLNHPNIASIYGVEERALVMELVDGPTLADRIANGPIASRRGARHSPADRRRAGSGA